MRIILALIYMAVGMWVYFKLGGGNLHPYIGMAVWFTLMFSSVVVCNEGFIRRLRGQSDKEYIQELLDKKLAVRENYKVKQALTFEDLSTGCLCHILEADEDKSLCLYGQYLYDYSQIDDDPEINQDRMFPTSEFFLIRKLKNSEILGMDIGGEVMSELHLEDVDVEKLHEMGIKLEDGEIIEGKAFSSIVEACK